MAACAGSAEEETSAGSEDALSASGAVAGTFGFVGSANTDLQQISISTGLAEAEVARAELSPMGGSSGLPGGGGGAAAAPIGGGVAVPIGPSYSAQVDIRVLDPNAVCPPELSPCTYNESGSWSVTETAPNEMRLRLTPKSPAGAARDYFFPKSDLPQSGPNVFTAAPDLHLHKGTLAGPLLHVRRAAAGASPVSLTRWGKCNTGFHAAILEPGNTPTPGNVNGLAAITSRCIVNLPTCNTTPIVSRTELMITHPNVVRDQVRARNQSGPAGKWTLGSLIKNMVPAGNATVAGDVLKEMLLSMKAPTIAGVAFDNQARGAQVDALIAGLPKLPDGVTIDLDKIHRTDVSPGSQKDFELVAIAYRPDLQGTGLDGVPKVGEGRFVFTRSDSFTLINEYELPVLMSGGTALTVAESRKIWALRFRALGEHPAFGDSYRALLERITMGFAGANVKKVGVATPNKNSIAQIRTNDIELGSPWQIREYNLQFVGATAKLNPVTTKGTPAREVRLGLAANGGAALKTDLLGQIMNNQAAVLNGSFNVQNQFLGPVADTFNGANFSAMFSGSGVPTNVQNAFINNTCNGCHANSTGGTPSFGFVHVRQTSSTITNAANLDAGQDRLSGFVNADMTGRANIMRSLVCQGQPRVIRGIEEAMQAQAPVENRSH